MQRLRIFPLALRAAWVPLGAVVLLSPSASYVVRTITALSAAAVLLGTTARRRNELRLARWFMAAALLVGAAAGVVSAMEQLARVRSYGCRYGQGFVLARPMPAAELGKLLAAGHVYQVDAYSLAVRPA